MEKPLTVLSLLGTRLDAGAREKRWDKWRPTVSIVQSAPRQVDRLILVADPGYDRLAGVVATDVVSVSPKTVVEHVCLPLEDPWDFGEVYAGLFDVAQAMGLDPETDELWVHLTTGTHVAQICLFLLVETGFLPGILVQTSPPKKTELPELLLIDLDRSRYDQIASRMAERMSDARDVLKAGIPTKNLAFNQLIDEVERVAVRSTASVLLMGPTGAGKTHLARQIYALKRQRRQLKGPMVEVNCATLRGDSAMSALFGHKRGAFTGANADRDGLLRSADGGLLFLDEVGELGPDEQAMLLRAIEDHTFLPVGSDKPVTSQFQLVTGTNRDLSQDVLSGRFRGDLLARIHTWTFRLPGLADRPEDIAPNVDVELLRYSDKTGRRVRMNREAQDRYLRFARSFSWPGNFRDLGASVERLCTLADDNRIRVHDVDRELIRLEQQSPQTAAVSDAVAAILGDAASELDRFDRVQLNDVLAVCAKSPSMSAAGRVLFAQSRERRTSKNDADRLRKYLARFELTWGDVASGA